MSSFNRIQFSVDFDFLWNYECLSLDSELEKVIERSENDLRSIDFFSWAISFAQFSSSSLNVSSGTNDLLHNRFKPMTVSWDSFMFVSAKEMQNL